jgi:hypothetical protein
MSDMEDTPPGASFGFARAQGGGPFPFPGVPVTPPEQVEFTDEQKRELASAVHEAEVAILRAIARSASHADPGYAARATARLTHALATLRVAAGQAHARSPFFPGPPWAMGPEGMEGFDAP